MDNLTVHKGKRVRGLIEGRGCELIYLPPYSPDFNPIEEAFSKVKAILRKVGARGREALVQAMGVALSAITPETPWVSSSIAATTNQPDYYEIRCRSLPASALRSLRYMPQGCRSIRRG